MTDRRTIETYEAVASEYHERNADRSGIESLIEEFVEAVEDATNGPRPRVADVGCGPGWETETFASRGHDAVGIDITEVFLAVARERTPDASFVRMDMRHLGLATDAFDGLWACASVLHLPRADVPETLSEFRRVLTPGGVACLSVKRGHGTETGTVYATDERRFTLYEPDEFEALLGDAGFDVESIGTDEADEWIQAMARA